jgi:hypothetical protein
MRTSLALIVALLLLPALAAAGIEGVYDCSGAGPDGGQYKGTVSIVKNGAAYNVTWNLGAEVYIGVGLLEGDHLAVGYSEARRGSSGVVVYKVKGETLDGLWAMQGAEKTGTETLTRRK